ncbi:MAG: outer membrane protein transport protein [Ignavibacteria bacterium]|nr:outer membrane protein transport protein [Ignavibacteria bacterium]
MKLRIYTILMLLSLGAGNIFAGGFQINEHGSKAMALGNAFTAVVDDASAVYWNSAGMSFMEGTNFLLGSALIGPSTKFRGVTPSVDKSPMISQIFLVPHFFVTHELSKSFSVGLGASVPFGLGTLWQEDWIGRYLAVETELQTIAVPLVVSWKITDNFSISAGGSYHHATVLIRQATSLAPFQGDAFIKLEGDESSAFGYNFSFMWKPLDVLSVGGSFKSEVDFSFTGTAEPNGPNQVASALPSGDISAKLTTPLNIQGGIALRVMKQLQLSADFQWIGWSSYDTLAVDFSDPAFDDLAEPRLYNDTYIIRFGVQYDISDELSLLGGVYYDKNPVDPENLSPSLPDSDRLGLSIGAAAQLTENFGVSGSYLFIRSSELTVANSNQEYTPGGARFNGTYNSLANLLSLSFHYSL